MPYNVARDGRKAYVYLVKEEATNATKFEVGKWYHVKKKATSGSTFGTIGVDHAFYCAKAVTSIPSGDEAVEMKLGFLGFAQGKDMTESKETTDVTADKDDSQNLVINPTTAVSGSISGIDLMEQYQASGFNAITELRQRFNTVVTYDENGQATQLDQKTATRDTILIGWDMREIVDGDPAAFDVVPCLLTSKARSSAYGSSQGMNFDFSGSDSSDTGLKRSHQQIIYKGLATA